MMNEIIINGIPLYIEEGDTWISDLVKKGDLVQSENGEYFWTKKHIRETIDYYIRIGRYLNSPYWRLYYNFIMAVKKKIYGY